MLQRIQTLYLLGVLINSTVLAYLLELWTSVDGVLMFAKDYPSILGVFGFSALFAFFSIFHQFLKIDFFGNRVFCYFLTFEWYFEAREHQNRTQHEKIPPGSYSQIFWPG